MSSLLKFAAVAAAIPVALAASGGAAAQTRTAETRTAQTWTAWSEADGRALIAAENGVVTEVEVGTAGQMRLYATIDGWMNLALYGDDCTDLGAKRSCKALAFNALFEVDDAARAQTLQAEMDFQYVADLADGDDIVIHRQVELEGGASLANIRAQLNGFVVVGELVYDRIWPSKDAAAPAKAR